MLRLPLVLCALTACKTMEAPQPPADDGPGSHRAEVRTVVAPDGEGGSRAWEYRLLVPRQKKEGPLPLILFLHGAGERGTDNDLQLTHMPELLLRDGGPPFDGYLLAPQCPEGQRWVETDWDRADPEPMAAEPSAPLAAAIAALERTLEEEPIDRQRIHLTGLSMGGYGTFDLGPRLAGLWATLTPICGGGDPDSAGAFPRVPIWIWHGVDDPAVPFQRSVLMAEALEAAGHEVRFERLPEGTGHWAWGPAYAPEGPWWSWIAAHPREAPGQATR